MASLGKLTNSIFSAVNENNVSLANLNFDFSLVTIQAPPEYRGLGNALTLRRRENAENGTAHRTARKLGALFDSIAPQAPFLLSAYGKRASQIISSPRVNPSGSTARHGPFVDFVGADGTSIWAAATSGSSSIAVHLLACLLARAFDDPAVATSVWAELVLDRQREIERLANSDFSPAQFAAVNAANQQFPREELRQWDASARAWLLGADAAMTREHTQLQLIIKNITLPVPSGGDSLYADVTSVWRHAMAGLERLLGGEPQSVTNGGILLAISSWHLYPNLVVLGSQVKTVNMKDFLFKDAGVVTIGMTRRREHADASGSAASEDGEGIYWSLSLSHYRYYGKPVQMVGRGSERLTIDELHMIALGSLFGAWNVPRANLLPAARWVVSLWACVDNAKKMLQRPLWLRVLARAAERLLTPAPDWDKRRCLALADFGHRRFRTLLGISRGHGRVSKKANSHLPWFGLRSPHILGALSRESPSEGAIQYLRDLATHGGLQHDDALITFVAPPSGCPARKGRYLHVYTSAAPFRTDQKRSAIPQPMSAVPDLEESEDIDLGWRNKGKNKASTGLSPDDQLVPKYWRWEGMFCKSGRVSDWRPMIRLDSDGDSYMKSYSQRSTADYSGESFFTPFSGGPTPSRSLEENFRELETPLVPERGDITEVQPNPSIPPKMIIHRPAKIAAGLSEISSSPLTFQGLLTSTQPFFQLWFKDSPSDSKHNEFEKRLRQLRSGAAETLVPLDTAVEQLQTMVNPLLLWQYFEGNDLYEPDDFIKPFLELMSPERKTCAENLRPIRNLATATTIYEKLEGATISSRIVETGLADAYWTVEDLDLTHTHRHAFACIAMLETGVVNLKPEDLANVVGLSVGNSLFVLSQFLADPSTRVSSAAVTRLVGNVGRPGVSLLVPPSARPLVRSLSTSYRAVSYAPFDGKWEDNFTSTSLHLSFTKHEFPVDYGVSGIMDHQVFLVESVFSVHEGGKWVADLDLVGAFSNDAFRLLALPHARSGKSCAHIEALVNEALQNAYSIDTWEEVLDEPPGISVVRAHKNWAARLAVATVLWQTCDERAAVANDNDEMDESPSSPSQPGSSMPPRLADFTVLRANEDACHVCVYRRVKRILKDSPNAGSCFYLVA